MIKIWVQRSRTTVFYIPLEIIEKLVEDHLRREHPGSFTGGAGRLVFDRGDNPLKLRAEITLEETP